MSAVEQNRCLLGNIECKARIWRWMNELEGGVVIVCSPDGSEHRVSGWRAVALRQLQGMPPEGYRCRT